MKNLLDLVLLCCIMGYHDFCRFSIDLSEDIAMSFSQTLHPIEVHQSATHPLSFNFCTDSYTNCHDASTWSKNQKFHYGRGRFFAIFKTHLRASAVAIFGKTPLSSTTHGYYKLVKYQLQYPFLPHLL